MDIIQKRFVELAEAAEQIEASKSERTISGKSSWSDQFSIEPTSPKQYTVIDIDCDLVVQWETSVLALLARVFGEASPTFDQFNSAVKQHEHFDNLKPIFLSAKDDYEGGYLFDVKKLVHAEVFSDELEQAKHFLDAKYKVPAAVIAGVVLETTLRKLCEQHDELEPADNLNRMNDDLVKANVYNKMRADQIRAWAKIRNDAAHGNPDEFDEGEVGRMIDGVRDFVAGQMS